MIAKFFETVFDPEDCVWVQPVDILTKSYAITQDSAMEFVGAKSPKGFYLSVGCADDIGIRKASENVSKMRNFLIEFDKGTLDEHPGWMRDYKLPYTARLLSGGKSTHFWISLEEPLPSIGEYKEWFVRLCLLLDKKNDVKCGDPARFSRFPGAFRGAKEQELQSVRRRIPNAQLRKLLFTAEIDVLYKREFDMKSQYAGPISMRFEAKDVDEHIAYLKERYPLVTGEKQGNMLVWARSLIGNCHLYDPDELLQILLDNDEGKHLIVSEYARVVSRSLANLPKQYTMGEIFDGSFLNG